MGGTEETRRELSVRRNEDVKLGLRGGGKDVRNGGKNKGER